MTVKYTRMKTWQIIQIVVLMICLVCAGLPGATVASVLPADVAIGASEKIQFSLESAPEQVEILILLKEQTDPEAVARQAVRQTAGLQDRDRAKDIVRKEVYQALARVAQREQASLLRYLEREADLGQAQGIYSFYITNVVAVTVPKDRVTAIAARQDVDSVWPNETLSVFLLDEEEPVASPASVLWNVERVHAPQVWNDVGVDGSGTVVGIIDTGVDWQHEALQSQYRGFDPEDPGFPSHAYHWFDPYYQNPYPDDLHGHGSHVAGTVVGTQPDTGLVLGVAPGAAWIAARGLKDNGSGYSDKLLAAMEFMLAPTPQADGSGTPDPTRAPDVVNNSWGGDLVCNPIFANAIAAWRAAGIVPVFAAGNEGPNAATIGLPGNYQNSFAVGALDDMNNLASFSSRGPGACGTFIKPDVSAPGVMIYSAISYSPGPPVRRRGYGYKSGTSMAAPHVAGVVALLRAHNPTLSVAEIETVLKNTAVPLTSGTYPASPNYGFGYGLVDARAAIEEIEGIYTIELQAAPLSGGTVTGGGFFAAGENAVVEAVPHEDYVFERWTEGDTEVSTDSTYAFAVTGSRTLTAHFQSILAFPDKKMVLADAVWTDEVIHGDVFVGPDALLTVDGEVTVHGNIFLYGKMRSYGKLIVHGTLYAKYIRDSITPLFHGTAELLGTVYEGDYAGYGGQDHYFQSINGVARVIDFIPFVISNPEDLENPDGEVTVAGASLPVVDITVNHWPVIVDESGYFSFTVDTDEEKVLTFSMTDVFGEQRTWEEVLFTYSIQLDAQPAQGGSVIGGGTFAHGETVVVQAEPATGYAFIDWQEGSETISAQAVYSFSADRDRTLTARFAVLEYMIHVSVSPAAGGSATGGGVYSHGDWVVLSAFPADGYQFAGWEEGGIMISTAPVYEFSAQGERTLEAMFIPIQYGIQVQADPEAGGAVTGSGSYLAGEPVTVTAWAAEGYAFAAWLENGTTVSTQAHYTFTADQNRTLTARFVQLEYTIGVTASPAAGGSITGGGLYYHGDDCILEALPAEGYTFLGWQEDDLFFHSEACLTFAVAGERTLTAVFSPIVPGEETRLVIPEHGLARVEFSLFPMTLELQTDTSGTVTLKPAALPPGSIPAGMIWAGMAWELVWSPELFSVPYRVEVAYQRDDLPLEIAEEELTFWHYHSGNQAWEPLTSGVDAGEGWVWAEGTGFSILGIFGPYQTVSRLSGGNRYQTAVQISKAGWPEGSDVVLLARGDEYADALAGVSLAHHLDAPVLLTATHRLELAAQTEIQRLGAERVIILGGTGAISPSVADTLRDMGLTVERIAGSNRYATAVDIAVRLVEEGLELQGAMVAVGTNFPDALAAASYAALNGRPILLTPKDTLSGATRKLIEDLDIADVIIVGGTGAVSETVAAELAELASVLRIQGSDRYATAVALADHFDASVQRMYVATGLDFPDAVTGAALAAKRGTGVLLVYGPDTVPPRCVRIYVEAKDIESVGLLGGSRVISDPIADWFMQSLSE